MTATSMKYTSAGLVATGGASICHAIMVVIFVGKYEWGFEGVVIATSIHLFLRYVFARMYLATITPLWEVTDVSFFSKETFENLGH